MEQDKYLNGSIREIDPAWADEVHERKCHLKPLQQQHVLRYPALTAKGYCRPWQQHVFSK